MNKSELIEELSMRMAIHPKKAESMVNTILNSMVKAMKDNRRVEIRGFGSFVMRDYFVGRNPKSGRKIHVREDPSLLQVRKDMRDRVNESGDDTLPPFLPIQGGRLDLTHLGKWGNTLAKGLYGNVLDTYCR